MVGRAIHLLIFCMALFLQADDPGIPPGGDPDIDEIPLDQVLWLFLLAGGCYGINYLKRDEKEKRNNPNPKQ